LAELGQEVGAAVVAGEADAGEGGGQDRGPGHDPQVAGERQRQARPGRRARQGGEGGLGHVEQLAGGGALVHPLAVDRLVDGGRLAAAVVAAGHALDVAAGAEALAGAGEDDDLDLGVELGGRQLGGQRVVHRPAHGVARLGAVERQGEHARVQVGEQVVGAGVDLAHGEVSLRLAAVRPLE
jgi:hypothetical protein